MGTQLQLGEKIRCHSEKRDKHDRYYPRQFIVRIGIVVYYPHQHNDRKKH